MLNFEEIFNDFFLEKLSNYNKVLINEFKEKINGLDKYRLS